MKHVFLGLGSNVGDREAYLNEALSFLGDHKHIRINCVSSIYETEPWGKADQSPFLNQVVEIETQCDPQKLILTCQKIEKDLGGAKRERWGPRRIDIDLLLYGDQIIDEENLQVPHLRLSERLFVLIPLCEVASGVTIPGLDLTVRNVLEKCLDRGSVKLYKKAESSCLRRI
ncbi:2-amino-4-hydroxy-6-hydroxymethyldihydropteridine diphosphokinase [bacterium]|nr:2-amino-4-hydroxy-6-hydroxymethyldihydropteridine diphosphokinase [bacterium]